MNGNASTVTFRIIIDYLLLLLLLRGDGAGYGISRNEGKIGEQTQKTDCKKKEKKKERKKE